MLINLHTTRSSSKWLQDPPYPSNSLIYTDLHFSHVYIYCRDSCASRCGANGSSPPGKRSPALTAVKTTRATVTVTERTARMSIRALDAPPFTSCAYSVAASASTVRGNEYAHHATLNRLIDRLNSAGLETCTGHRRPRQKPIERSMHASTCSTDELGGWKGTAEFEFSTFLRGLCYLVALPSFRSLLPTLSANVYATQLCVFCTRFSLKLLLFDFRSRFSFSVDQSSHEGNKLMNVLKSHNSSKVDDAGLQEVI